MWSFKTSYCERILSLSFELVMTYYHIRWFYSLACRTRLCDNNFNFDPTPRSEVHILSRSPAQLMHCPHNAEDEGKQLPIQDLWLKRLPRKKRSLLTLSFISMDAKMCHWIWRSLLKRWLIKGNLLALSIGAIFFLDCWYSKGGESQSILATAALLLALARQTTTAFGTALVMRRENVEVL